MSETYACCTCCPDDDPAWHEENGRDTHTAPCSLCDRTPAPTVSVDDANRVLAEERTTHEKTAADLAAAQAWAAWFAAAYADTAETLMWTEEALGLRKVDVEIANAQRDLAQAAVTRVRDLHRTVDSYLDATDGCHCDDHDLFETGDGIVCRTCTDEDGGPAKVCAECSDDDGSAVDAPCATIRLLDGES
ncbi:hypothetical protein SEA_VANLEE_82 [Gordonia phage VanLee]|uniref:Uncharacterized protein n=1 Tax=Gordonia phage VanLee TaxID=2845816 RepID=A0A8F2D9G0_9CAUD|nr:hypothetical protein QEH49_gp082 [Gordonia phage VanLee]QWS68199.1 hypothetical protein SEA_VANLEE_82 [Gordonia phage VanLee]